MNKGVTRLGDALQVRKGRPRKVKGVGRGRYKSFTAQTMLRSTRLALPSVVSKCHTVVIWSRTMDFNMWCFLSRGKTNWF